MVQTLQATAEQAIHDAFEKQNPHTADFCRKCLARGFSRAQVKEMTVQAMLKVNVNPADTPNMLNALDCWLAVEVAG
jgi:hypothetical protein